MFQEIYDVKFLSYPVFSLLMQLLVLSVTEPVAPLNFCRLPIFNMGKDGLIYSLPSFFHEQIRNEVTFQAIAEKSREYS